VNLLGAILYDPAVAVNKVTTAAIAMTAIDTVNLRLAITVPAHGKVRFRLMAVIHGATTFPSILMGVMNGAAVIGRVAPVQSLGNTAVATALVNVEADFIATGLAPGAMNCDAAYAVETLVAATGLKYGGPNNAVANDAFGGFVFEAWDPQPQTANSMLAVDANGRVDVAKVAGTAQTARDLGAQLDAAVSTRLAPTTAGRTLDVTATGEAGIDLDNTAGTLSAAEIPNLDAAITTRAAAATAVSNVDYTAARAAKLDNLDATISSRSIYAGGDTAGTTTLLARITALRAGNLDNLDATISSRSVYGGGDTAGTTTLLGRITTGRAANLDNVDAAVSSRLSAAGYLAPDNAGVAAIRAKTDSLTFSLANKIDAHVLAVNGNAMQGLGTEAAPWRSV
jgi:hypothetical protein